MLYAVAFLFVYLMLAIFSKGTTVVWTWYALVWVWGLAPVPFTILLIIMPVFITVMAFVARSGVSSPRDALYPDRRRTNPADKAGKKRRVSDGQQSDEPKQRTVQDRVDEEERSSWDSATIPDLDKLFNEPHTTKSPPYTEHVKPTQPKIWGIDD